MNQAKAAPRSLADLPVGSRAVVVAVSGTPDLRRRLAELGVLPGAAVHVVRRAPWGCPMEFDIDGARYAVRRETAEGVLVEDAQ